MPESRRCVPARTFVAARDRGELAIERAFFANLRLRDGVFKTTHEHRLDDTLPAMIAHVRGFAPPLRALDAGCSSGVSTVEMHRAFAGAGIECETYGVDKTIRTTHVRRADGCGLLFDRESRVLQVDIDDWAMSWAGPPRRRDWIVNGRSIARAFALMTLEASRFRAAMRRPGAGYEVCQIDLVSSAVEGVTGVRICEEDITRPTVDGGFHVIRAANLLNRGYFSPAALQARVRALAARLVEFGILFVVRTHPDLGNAGSFFRKDDDKLVEVAQLNGGSEIATLI